MYDECNSIEDHACGRDAGECGSATRHFNDDWTLSVSFQKNRAVIAHPDVYWRLGFLGDEGRPLATVWVQGTYVEGDGPRYHRIAPM